MNGLTIVIPSYEPDSRLVSLVKTLSNDALGNFDIVVVDDGSGSKYESVFREVSQHNCTILKHHVNLGKGRALKTAINYILNERQDCLGIVTIDSDGQHTIEDMQSCIDIFTDNPDKLVLGVRDFVNEVPMRSRFGNVVTRSILGLLTGIRLNDTQTGLRVIPANYMKHLLSIKGERFEFEMNMILESSTYHIDIVEVPIETIYLDDNASSHFRVFKDSLQIYGSFLKYMLSSGSASLIDILAFTLLLNVLPFSESINVVAASFIARLISSIYNYSINQKLVFKSHDKYSLFKYYGLVLAQISISSIFVMGGRLVFGQTHITLIKVIIDVLLFFTSFYVQKQFVFKG